MLVVAIASHQEMACLREKIVLHEKKVVSGVQFFRGQLQKQDMLLVRTGVGAKKAGRAMRCLAQHYAPAVVLLLGAAGALDPSLHIGDIIIIRNIVTKTGVQYTCDEALGKDAFNVLQKTGLPVMWGNCLSVDRFTHHCVEKKRLLREYGVQAIDMESAAAAQVLQQEGIPFFCIRSISDTARENTVDIEQLYKFKKRMGLLGTCLYFAKNPADIIRAAKLRKHLALVGCRISRIVELLSPRVPV